jgi:hypothetical protein
LAHGILIINLEYICWFVTEKQLMGKATSYVQIKYEVMGQATIDE